MSKKRTITGNDYVKACRKASREEEIASHGRPIPQRRVHRSKKQYDRNRIKADLKRLPFDFLDISYLEYGNDRQQSAYSAISELSILKILEAHQPIVAGTIPIGIDTPDSDLDIICRASDIADFQKLVRRHFLTYSGFGDSVENNRYTASFFFNDLRIEIYAENNPTVLQNAYLHMVIEGMLLNIGGEDFRRKIMELKNTGWKTEPAFGQILHLKEPYTELIELLELSDEQLQKLITDEEL